MNKTYFESSEVADNQISAMGDVVRSCGSERGLFTIKRLINSGRTKRLFFGAFTAIFVAVASMLIFYGCRKDVADGQSLPYFFCGLKFVKSQKTYIKIHFCTRTKG